jgi:hypothetical protein
MRLRKNDDSWPGICSIALLLTLMTGAAVAEERQALSRRQTVYVPVYSLIWYGNVDSRLKASKLLLSSMLSIRNVDPESQHRGEHGAVPRHRRQAVEGG